MEKQTVSVLDCLVIHFAANNNTNGNLQRLFAIYHSEQGLLCCVDEGYDGINALREVCNSNETVFAILNSRVHSRIEVSFSYYKKMLRTSPVNKMKYIFGTVIL